jgi:zinc transport system substrate-binding protein
MLSRTPRTALAVTAASLLLSTVAACGDGAAGSSPADGGKAAVVTAFYPLQFISERIGGDAVTVGNLTKPGAEPHDLELSPRQVGEISDAALVVYLHGFQPAVDDAVTQQAKDRAFDAATVAPLLDAAADPHAGETEPGQAESGQAESGQAESGQAEPEEAGHEEEAGGKDPHVWLDPTRLAAIADRLAVRLGQADPAHAADYTARAAALHTDLTKLDAEYTAKLANCQRRQIVTSHSAFNYLAQRYRLEQVGITGLSPEAEPSAQRLAAVAEEAKEHGATTIFFETLVSPKIAETIAREVGARTAVLDPLEGLSAGGGDYLSVMRTNLTALTAALGCP